MSRLGPPTPLEDVLEHEWQKGVLDLAKTLGYKTWRNFNARKSDFGWPDLFLCGRGRRIHLELKREKGKPTEQQKDWLRAIDQNGGEAYIARPRDLDLLAAVLTSKPLVEPTEAMARLRLQTMAEVGG